MAVVRRGVTRVLPVAQAAASRWAPWGRGSLSAPVVACAVASQRSPVPQHARVRGTENESALPPARPGPGQAPAQVQATHPPPQPSAPGPTLSWVESLYNLGGVELNLLLFLRDLESLLPRLLTVTASTNLNPIALRFACRVLQKTIFDFHPKGRKVPSPCAHFLLVANCTFFKLSLRCTLNEIRTCCLKVSKAKLFGDFEHNCPLTNCYPLVWQNDGKTTWYGQTESAARFANGLP